MTYSLINFIFSILSLAYIAGIFLLADSSVVKKLSLFNPYSLLHIPLYSILTGLLVFSFVPLKFNRKNSSALNRISATNPTNPINALTQERNPLTRFLVSGLIAFTIAIADEIHQSFIPTRNASISDVLLDTVGIALTSMLLFWLFNSKRLIIKGKG